MLLAILFIVIPAIELALLIEVGGLIGGFRTFALIVITGIVGAQLARRQGLGVLAQLQADVAAGRPPAGSLADGLIILFAGALLLTPGILTDAFGFLCLIPGARTLAKGWLLERAKGHFERQGGAMFGGFGHPGGGRGGPAGSEPAPNRAGGVGGAGDGPKSAEPVISFGPPKPKSPPVGGGPVIDITPEK